MKFVSWPVDKIKEKTDKKFSDLIGWSTLWIDDGIINAALIEWNSVVLSTYPSISAESLQEWNDSVSSIVKER